LNILIEWSTTCSTFSMEKINSIWTLYIWKTVFPYIYCTNWIASNLRLLVFHYFNINVTHSSFESSTIFFEVKVFPFLERLLSHKGLRVDSFNR
jgi:hypothetical protein